MKTVEEVLRKYTLGEAGKDETNDDLKELGSPLCLNPDRNVITPEELAETRVGVTPDEANGYGLMEHGAGSLEKSMWWTAARWTWTWARRPPMSTSPGASIACGATC